MKCRSILLTGGSVSIFLRYSLSSIFVGDVLIFLGTLLARPSSRPAELGSGNDLPSQPLGLWGDADLLLLLLWMDVSHGRYRDKVEGDLSPTYPTRQCALPQLHWSLPGGA